MDLSSKSTAPTRLRAAVPDPRVNSPVLGETVFIELYDLAGDEFVLRCRADLASCFPDDAEGLTEAELQIGAQGFAIFGGGAAPVVKLVEIEGGLS
jgi:hypothetical protein